MPKLQLHNLNYNELDTLRLRLQTECRRALDGYIRNPTSSTYENFEQMRDYYEATLAQIAEREEAMLIIFDIATCLHLFDIKFTRRNGTIYIL